MRVAFKMKLFDGCEEEYRRRHDKIWPDLQVLLKSVGISDYSIFLDTETNILFAFLKNDDLTKMNGLSCDPLMHKWWDYMKDIMETNKDNSPVSTALREVFYLP
jgi:L-rhamnose mutarotase